MLVSWPSHQMFECALRLGFLKLQNNIHFYSCFIQLQASYNSARERHASVAALKHKHAEQITRLTNTLREKEITWQQQRKDMEQHYMKMLNDMQLLSKVQFVSYLRRVCDMSVCINTCMHLCEELYGEMVKSLFCSKVMDSHLGCNIWFTSEFFSEILGIIAW